MGAYHHSTIVCLVQMMFGVLRYTLFLWKRNIFQYMGGLNALVLFELNVTKRKPNETGTGLSWLRLGSLCLFSQDEFLATKYYAQRSSPVQRSLFTILNCSWKWTWTIVKVFSASLGCDYWVEESHQKVGMNICNQKLRLQNITLFLYNWIYFPSQGPFLTDSENLISSLPDQLSQSSALLPFHVWI